MTQNIVTQILATLGLVVKSIAYVIVIPLITSLTPFVNFKQVSSPEKHEFSANESTTYAENKSEIADELYFYVDLSKDEEIVANEPAVLAEFTTVEQEIEQEEIADNEKLAVEDDETIPEAETYFTAEISNKVTTKKNYYSELSKKVEYEKSLRDDINKLVRYLKAQGSPVASEKYARQIIVTSQASGTDYKLIVAIMGVESGFCAVNVLTYNCFGYLNGFQYSSYTHAFDKLIPQIARFYTIPYGTNFRALATAYGIHDVDKHSTRMSSYYYGLANF